MQFVEICPIFVGSYIWMLWFERNFSLSGNSVYSFCEKSAQFLSASKFFIVLIFFLCTNALKYYRFKMMDRYQLEQKSSRDMWQLGLDNLQKLIALNEIMPWRMTNIFGSTVIYCMNHIICVVFISYHLMNKIWFNWI